MDWFVYIIECNDHSYYTGITNKLEKRILQHNNNQGAKYVKGKLPVKLIYKEVFNNKIDALKREFEIKSWNKLKKIELIFSRSASSTPI